MSTVCLVTCQNTLSGISEAELMLRNLYRIYVFKINKINANTSHHGYHITWTKFIVDIFISLFCFIQTTMCLTSKAFTVRFHALMMASIKIAVFQDISPWFQQKQTDVSGVHTAPSSEWWVHVVCTSEMLIYFNETTCSYIPQGCHLHRHITYQFILCFFSHMRI
jgi:hypothetical protein